MDLNTSYILAGLIIAVLIVLYLTKKESFANKEEKANAIVGWFSNNTPEYEKYRADLKFQSNVVEYNDAKKLKKDNNLNVNTLLPTL